MAVGPFSSPTVRVAFDELAKLASNRSHRLEQFLVGMPYLTAEKLHNSQNLFAQQNWKSEACLQSCTRGNGRAEKTRLVRTQPSLDRHWTR